MADTRWLTARSRGTPLAPEADPSIRSPWELLYWSDMRGRWRTFGNFGPLRLTLERARRSFARKQSFTSSRGDEAAYFSIKSS